MSADFDSLNPFTGIQAISYEIYQLEYPTLTSYSVKDFAAVPGLASSWEESADHKTWTFHLRDGVKWTDGQPLTSADVVYTFNRILKGEYEKTNYSAYTGTITSVTAPDATTVVFTVSKPSPIMLHLYVYILPEHIWKNVSEAQVKSFSNEPSPGNPTVGAGPFVVTERKTGQYVTLTANPNYFGGSPHVKNLVFRVFNNSDALGQALKKGEIDYVDQLDANVYKSLAGATGVTSVAAQYNGFSEFAFNTGAALVDGTPIGDGNPLLKDVRLRQALSWAVDRKALVDKVYNGYGTEGDSVIPPIYTSLHYTPTADGKFGYDPAKAQALLDAAGYKVGPDGIRVSPTGQRLSFRVFGRSSSDTSKKAVEFFQGYLKAVGVDTQVKLYAEDQLTSILGQGNFDIFEWGWGVEPDPNYQLSTFTCAQRSYKDGATIYGGLSDSFYCDPAYDKLFAQQAATTDPAARAPIVQQMEKLLYDSASYLIYVNYDDTLAYRGDRWTGLQPQPDPSGPFLFQFGVWSYTTLAPVAASAESASSSKLPLVGGIVAAILVVGLVVLVLRRRGGPASADDRE
jgi:peptide/nickel transport system substrate-binding protein